MLFCPGGKIRAMDTSNPVLHGLLRKRQEIADKLELAQSQVRQLILDIDAVDSTIRLFHPKAFIYVLDPT